MLEVCSKVWVFQYGKAGAPDGRVKTRPVVESIAKHSEVFSEELSFNLSCVDRPGPLRPANGCLLDHLEASSEAAEVGI
jgi:hypothetical protein